MTRMRLSELKRAISEAVKNVVEASEDYKFTAAENSVECSKCGDEAYLNKSKTFYKCRTCGALYDAPASLKSDEESRYLSFSSLIERVGNYNTNSL